MLRCVVCGRVLRGGGLSLELCLEELEVGLELSIGEHECFEVGLELCVRCQHLLKTQLSSALQLIMRERNSLFTTSRRKESFLESGVLDDDQRPVTSMVTAAALRVMAGEGADREYLG